MSTPPLRDLLDRLVTAMVDGKITLDEGRRAFETRFIQQVLEGTDGTLGGRRRSTRHPPQHAHPQDRRVPIRTGSRGSQRPGCREAVSDADM